MTNHLKAAVHGFTLAIPLFCGTIAAAQQKKPPQPAPVTAPIPAQILSAVKVFIANAGGDETRYDDPLYSGGPDRTYNEFYAAMRSWGRYQLVAAPADANLVFEIRLTVIRLRREGVLSDDSPTTDSQFRIVIRDPRTHQILWALTEQPLAAIVAEVQRIAGPPAADPANN
jgi:hypothetical protein